MKYLFIIIFLSLFFSPSKLEAQTNGEIWIFDFFQIRKKNAIFQCDLAIRSSKWFSTFNKYHIRAGGGYRFNDHWRISSKLAYFHTNLTEGNINEFRIDFDANYAKNIFRSRVVFHYRPRLESRFLWLPLNEFENSLRIN